MSLHWRSQKKAEQITIIISDRDRESERADRERERERERDNHEALRKTATASKGLVYLVRMSLFLHSLFVTLGQTLHGCKSTPTQ